MTIFQFFRKYERPLYWFVVIFILPAMGVTGTLLVVMGSHERPPFGRVFGQPVTPEEVEVLQRRLRAVIGLGMVTEGVIFRHVPYGIEGTSEADMVMRQLALQQKADDAHIQVSDAELANEVKRLYRGYIAYEQAQREVARDPNAQEGLMRGFQIWQRSRQIQEQLATQPFDLARYREILSTYGVTPHEFEDTLRGVLAAFRLQTMVRESATITPDAVWEAYQEKYHARRIEFSAFTPDQFAYEDTAEGPHAPPPALVRRYYDEHQDHYRNPAQVRFRYAAADVSQFPVADPTPEEVQTYYEANRAAIVDALQVREPPPLEELRDWVAERMRIERRIAAARTALDAVRARLVADPATATDALADAPRIAAAAPDPMEPAGVYGLTPVDAAVSGTFLSHEAAGAISGVLETDLFRLEDARGRAYFNPPRRPRHLAVIQLQERIESAARPFDGEGGVAAQVRADLVGATDDEINAEYATHSDRYQRPEQLLVEVAWGEVAAFRERTHPTDDELRAYFEQHHDAFGAPPPPVPPPGEGQGTGEAPPPAEVRFEDVREAVLSRYLDEKSRQQLDDEINAAQNEYQTAATGQDPTEMDIESYALNHHLRYERVSGEMSTITAHPILSNPVLQARIGSRSDAIGDACEPSPVTSPDGMAFYAVRRRDPAATAPLADVRDRVRERAILTKRQEWTSRAAEEFRGRVLGGETFEAAAARAGREAVRSDWLRRDQLDSGFQIPGLPTGVNVGRSVFTVEVGQVSQVEHAPDDAAFVVWRVAERGSAPPDRWEASQPELRPRAIQDAQMRFLRRWQDDLLLQAKGVVVAAGEEGPHADDVIQEAYDLRYGPSGVASYRVIDLLIPAEHATIERIAMEAAHDAIVRVATGIDPTRFEALARDRDEGSHLGGSWMVGPTDEPATYAIAQSLAVGAVSEPIQVVEPAGWAILRLEAREGDRLRVREVRLLADAVKRRLTAEQVTPALDAARAEAQATLDLIRSGETTLLAEATRNPGAQAEVTRPCLTRFAADVLGAAPASVVGPLPTGDGRQHLLWIDEQIRASEDQFGGTDLTRTLEAHRIVAEGGDAADRLAALRAEIEADARRRAEEAGEAGSSLVPWMRQAFLDRARAASAAPSARAGGAIARIEVTSDVEEIVRLGDAYRLALAALEPGRMSDLIPCPDGFRIVLLLSADDQKIEDVRPALAADLLELTPW